MSKITFDISSALTGVTELIVAGWTGRDKEAMEAHISELEQLGVARPKTTPLFYRVASSLLTTDRAIQTPGKESSGEVEAILINHDQTIWIGIGSDHTDREIETVSVTASKQMCAKPVGPQMWRFSDVDDHWDRLELKAYASLDGERRLYQRGVANTLRHPKDLLALKFGEGARLPAQHAMFCGTVPVIGDISFADKFEIELIDPVLGRCLKHSYTIQSLPVKG